MLKKIKISGLRGFGKEETIEFSLPNGNKGSGLNVIVGPNSSGKTTIIEAVRYFNASSINISFSEGKRNRKNNNKIDIIYLDNKNKISELHTVETGGSQIYVKGKQMKIKCLMFYLQEDMLNIICIIIIILQREIHIY